MSDSRILLVDDEAALVESLGRLLAREGYAVDVAADGATGSDLAARNRYDLLILDWMLPQASGLDICEQLRSRGDATPVLFLTAKDTLDDRVRGLDAGADDYLVKPFELRELLARVRALLRRSQALNAAADSPATGRCLACEGLELDCENQTARRQDRTIDLSDKEARLLEYLMRHPGQLLGHDRLYRHLWPEGDRPSSNALAAQIRLLRRKIEAIGETPLIHSVYGKGYRFGTGSDRGEAGDR